jgi:putative flippase GtrA
MKSSNGSKDMPLNIWTKRFIAAAIIQGAIIVALTIFLVLSQISLLKPEVSRVIASGGAGTWFTFGYLIYIIVGVIGVAVSAVFYHIAYHLGKQRYYRTNRIVQGLAWSHLFLMNIGIVAAAGMLMYAGYAAGAAMLPESVGGKGFDNAQAHEILAPFVEPISAAILVLGLGVILGGIGFLLANYHEYKIKD